MLLEILKTSKIYIILETAVRDAKLAQDLELESLCSGAGHSRLVKDRPTANDSGSRDCVKLASPTAVFRIIRLLSKLAFTSAACKIILGSIFLGLMSQFAIPLPFSPVPITLQTFGVACLSIALTPHQAAFAVMTYLLQGTLGFPVFAGGVSNPLWWMGPRGGYLFCFVLAVYLRSKWLRTCNPLSFFKIWLILFVGDAMILFAGTLWLMLFLGIKEAVFAGMIPFLPGTFLKTTTAAALAKFFFGWRK